MFNFAHKKIDFSHKLDNGTLVADDFKKHMHDHYELLLLVDGNLDYTVESETRTLKKGDMVLIKPGELHFGTPDTRVPYERYVLKFPGEIVSKYLLNKLAKCPTFGNMIPDNPITVFSEFDDIDADFTRDEGDDKYLLMFCLLIKILVYICRYNARPSVSQNTEKNEFISQVTRYISNNLQKNFTLATLSRDLHYSRSYISSEFSKVLHMPIMTYIKYKKIIAAHREIIEGNKKASDVALKYGFNEYTTFYRNYKKVIGHPPADDKLSEEEEQKAPAVNIPDMPEDDDD